MSSIKCIRFTHQDGSEVEFDFVTNPVSVYTNIELGTYYGSFGHTLNPDDIDLKKLHQALTEYLTNKGLI